jgi:hypothetical protein
MGQLKNVFLASGAGTKMNISTTNIHDISAPAVWDGITFASGATGVVQGSQILRNSGLEVRQSWTKSVYMGSSHPLTHALSFLAVWGGGYWRKYRKLVGHYHRQQHGVGKSYKRRRARKVVRIVLFSSLYFGFTLERYGGNCRCDCFE